VQAIDPAQVRRSPQAAKQQGRISYSSSFRDSKSQEKSTLGLCLESNESLADTERGSIQPSIPDRQLLA
jgi:hypothetical protein